MRSLLLALIVVTGCAPSESETLTWDEFLANVHQEEDTGLYIVNGDEVVPSIQELAAFYERLVAERAGEIAETTAGLAVNRVGGRDDKWSATQARNLTYCVSRSSFGTRYNSAVSAMASATAAWSNVANVRFVHNSSQDGNCTASNPNVVFDVRQTSSAAYLARAFFPSSGRSYRNVIISRSAFGNLGSITLAGVLRHELGHALGFRHEHTRPEAGACFEDNGWRALTPYDRASVMHYPHCNGNNRGDLVITTRDRDGARALYP